MIRLDRCPVCSRRDLSRLPATIAPFFRESAFGGRAVDDVHLCLCPGCAMIFFDARPSAEEADRFYGEYRGADYVRSRDLHEPGYARINDMISSPREVSARRAGIERALGGVPFATPARVLDFGGDKGQFIPARWSGAERFVIDLSRNPLPPDIERLTALPGRPFFDAILCCHVLEHASDPLAMLRGLRDNLEEDGILYLEVPWEIGIKVYLSLARGRWTGLRRSPRQLNEHLNYFSLAALANLLPMAGLKTLRCATHNLDLGWSRVSVLSCVARKAPIPAGGPPYPPAPGPLLAETGILLLRLAGNSICAYLQPRR